MARPKKYADLTKLANGLYEKTVTVQGVRHVFRSKNPDIVYAKLEAFRNPTPTFSAVAEQWREAHFATIGAGTQSAYRSAVARAIEAVGHKLITDVTAADMDALLLRLKSQGLSAKSVRNQKCVCNMIFNYAIVQDYVKYNPTTAVRVPSGLTKTIREAPEEDEIQIVRDSVKCYFGLFAYFLLHTGCRKGEALAITGGDIDRQNKVIRITKAVEFVSGVPNLKSPKTAAGTREIPLLDALAKELPPLKKDQLLFAQENGDLFSSKTYERHWKHYCKDAGFVTYVPEARVSTKGKHYIYQKATLTLTAHQLRHGFATILYEAGIDAQLAKDLLGHSDIAVTQQIYTHIRNKKRSSAGDLLNKYFNNDTQ